LDSAAYVALTRQSGLLKELQITANNIANASTTGYRAEGVVFAEMIENSDSEGGSISMTDARVRYTSELGGGLTQTGGTFDGYRVLDGGGAPIFIPPDQPNISISADGTISNAEGPISQIGVVGPAENSDLIREDGVFFSAPNGAEQVIDPFVLQGHIEASNVDPVAEIARLIEVQRAYEATQKFLEKEDERMRSVVRTLGTS